MWTHTSLHMLRKKAITTWETLIYVRYYNMSDPWAIDISIWLDISPNRLWSTITVVNVNWEKKPPRRHTDPSRQLLAEFTLDETLKQAYETLQACCTYSSTSLLFLTRGS